MKRFVTLCLLACVLMIAGASCQAQPAATPTLVPPTATPLPPTPTPAPPTPAAADVASKLHWFGTSAFLYRGSQTIYFDPIGLGGDLPPADIILISHAHSDHWSPTDIKTIIGPDTVLIISPNVTVAYEASKDALGIPAKILGEGETAEVDGVSIQAVPAYTNDGGHPREGKSVGYIVTVDGARIYHAGSTDAYPEMAQYQCDVALIPVYSKDRANALVKAIPAKAFIFDHTSFYAAQSLATLLANDLGDQQTFVTLEAGPNKP
jgi:hypothetical protein